MNIRSCVPVSRTALAILKMILLAAASQSCRQSDAPQAYAPTAAALQLGINIEGLAYWGTEVPFVNLMKMASPWLTQCDSHRDALCADGLFVESGATAWDTKEQGKLKLDAQGSPQSLPDPSQASATSTNYTTVSSLVPTGLSAVRPSGRFIVLYDGEGTLGYGRGAVRNAALSSPGRDVIDVTSDGIQTWFQLSILATDPGKRGQHIRSLRVIPAGGVCGSDPTLSCGDQAQACPPGDSCRSFEQTPSPPLFHPRFLKNLSPFRTIRFMAYQNTNASFVEHWDDRTQPERVTWVSEHGDGGPVEAIAALGNQLGADIWVNMPTRSNDDYVRQFATYIRDHLDARRSVYVEYSNEVWNSQFSAATWAQARGLTRWPAAKDTPFGKQLQWYGLRSAEVCDLWRTVFASGAERVRCVMGAQGANAWTARQALECPLHAAESGGQACVKHGIRGLAIAPYFGYYLGHPKHLATVKAWTTQPEGGLDNLFAELFQGGALSDAPVGGALAEAREQMHQAAAAAGAHGIDLLAYEGGQHLVGLLEVAADKAVSELFIAANRDPRMADAYRAHLADWRAAGGRLYNLWNSVGSYTQWGSWGLLEYRDQPSSPKYHAVSELIANEPRSPP